MSLTVLSVAYPLAPVGRDAAGGAEQILSALDRALVAAGHRSLVIACEGSAVAGTLIPISAETGPLNDATRARAQIAVRRAIADALVRWRVDLVHLHGIDFFAYAPADDVPTLVTLHLPLGWYSSDALAPRPNRFLHCVSEAQARTAPEGVRLLPPIPNGVPLDAFSEHSPKQDFCLTLGRICPEKGVHLALQAARRAGRPLVIAGQVFRYEAHERYFAEEVRPLLDDNRRFVGPVGFAEKRRLLAEARCVLVPSLAPETSSLVAMEAAASGTPVIAYSSGALPETVEHGVTGLIVSDVEAMAAAIGAVDAIDPEACRAAARRRFSEAGMAERYFDAYRRVLSGTAGRAP